MSGSTPRDVAELTTDPQAVYALLDGWDGPIARDDFAGPGGWSTGIADVLAAAGVLEVALEWDAAACLTRIANGHVRTIRADVAAYPVGPFLGRTKVYIGSPPCQTFSNAGKGAGRKYLDLLHDLVIDVLLGHRTYEEAMAVLHDAGALRREPTKDELDAASQRKDPAAYLDGLDLEDDPRNGLILIPARVIRQLLDHPDPKHPLEAVALEQVPQAGRVFDGYAYALRRLGFNVITVKLNAADYGVPQTRERRFVMASRTRRIVLPEPSHCRGGEEPTLMGPGRLRWVSMARALGWGAGYELRQQRGAGQVDRYGDRPGRAMDSDPAFTLTGGNPDLGGNVRLRFEAIDASLTNGHQQHSTTRHVGEPAATITGGKDYNDRHFIPHTEEAGRFLLDRRAGAPDADGNYTSGPKANGNGAPLVDVGVMPSPSVTSSAFGKSQWKVTDRLAGSEEFDGEWAEDRPATVVASREIVQHPGATKNRFNDSNKTRNDGLRITEEEGAVLQGFPASYTWTGDSKGKRWEQIGNVVCPPVARVIVCELLGVPWSPLPWHAYAFDDADPKAPTAGRQGGARPAPATR